MIGKGLSYIQYKRVCAQIDRAQKELKQSVETMVTCSDLDEPRKRRLNSKIDIVEARCRELRQQVGTIS